MTSEERRKTEAPPGAAPVIDLLKRHTAMPSRQLVLSEAYEMARGLQCERVTPSPAAEQADAPDPGE